LPLFVVLVLDPLGRDAGQQAAEGLQGGGDGALAPFESLAARRQVPGKLAWLVRGDGQYALVAAGRLDDEPGLPWVLDPFREDGPAVQEGGLAALATQVDVDIIPCHRITSVYC